MPEQNEDFAAEDMQFTDPEPSAMPAEFATLDDSVVQQDTRHPAWEWVHFFMCLTGWLGYVVLTLFFVGFYLFLFFAFVVTAQDEIFSRTGLSFNGDQFGLGPLRNIFANYLAALYTLNPGPIIMMIIMLPLMIIWWLFAGFMGWGAFKAKPICVPWYMMRSVWRRAKPNRLTFILSFPTLAIIGYIGIGIALYGW